MGESGQGPVLVTGATGFIGRSVVRRLGAAGRAVRCLVRDPVLAERAGLPPASLVVGALEDPVALARATAGCRAVLHLAGATRALGARGFHAANALGTARLAAATPDGVRFVQVSSLAAAGPSVDGASSSVRAEDGRPCSHYGRSKRDGELALLEHAARLDWCVVRPPIVYGPGDAGTDLLVRGALAFLAPVPWRRRPLSLVHVTDLTDALIRALERPGVPGFLPIDGPERADTTSLVQRIARAAGRRARPLPLPMWLILACGPLADFVHRLRGSAGFLCSDKLREVAAVGWVADPEPARAALDFVARVGIDEGFATVLGPASAPPV